MPRLGVAQFRPGKGDSAENLERIGALLAGLPGRDAAPELLLFPEAALTGYLLEGGVRDLAVSAGTLFEGLQRVHAQAKAPTLDIAIGFYESWRGSLYNSSLYATLGGKDARIVHVHRKVFLPTYGVFDEERFTEPGLDVRAFDTRLGRFGVLICEDAWHSLPPLIAAVQGAQLLLIHSASPARGMQPLEETVPRPANVSRWERMSRAIAEEHGMWVATCQLVGFEGGKAFAGGSVVVTPRGDVVSRAPLWEETLLEVDVDLREVGRARADLPLLADLQTKLPHLIRSLETAPSAAPPYDGSTQTDGTPARRHADTPDPMAMDAALVERWLVEFLREEVTRRRGFSHVVVGISGGVDSALVAFLAAKAFGPEHVTGLLLPYRTSSPESLAHGKLVVSTLGIAGRVIDISDAVDGYFKEHEPEADEARRGNVMARERMIVLFDQSAKLRALPLGTGNKTERLFGYFTWHADDSPPINPIGDLFKSQVWALARHVGVPDVIVDKPATADLVKGQTDEGDLGIPYPRADRILYWLLRGLPAPDIVGLGFTTDEVLIVEKRLESTHWKRRMPTVAMLSPTAIGEYYLRPVDY
ncbi:MAG TPA: NAD+ synthase [Dongiaceae bacterium]|nr:NAD+ synthase [Dongiaceae bacterium]